MNGKNAMTATHSLTPLSPLFCNFSENCYIPPYYRNANGCGIANKVCADAAVTNDNEVLPKAKLLNNQNDMEPQPSPKGEGSPLDVVLSIPPSTVIFAL